MHTLDTLFALDAAEADIGRMQLHRGRIRDCDDTLCRLFGRSRGGLRGREPAELSEPQQPGGPAAAAWAERERAAAAGLPQQFLWRFCRAEDGAFQALVHLGAAPGDGSQLLVQVRDLHRLRHARVALQESEARLQQVVDNTPALIFAKDREGRFLFVNREFERIAGRPAHEIIGRTDQELFTPELAARFRHNDLRVLLEGRGIEFEESGEFGGTPRTFLSSKFPLFDAGGVPYGLCGMATDITERKRLEAALSSAALAVSSTEGETLFAELTRYLATILGVELAFIATLPEQPDARLCMLALHLDGATRENFDYAMAGTPCELVIERGSQLFPSRLTELFPFDDQFKALGVQSYAGHPLRSADGRPLGLIAVASRRPIEQPAFVESVLRIFAVRAAAELERARAAERLRLSESSYREIFEAAPIAIFVHDWDSGAIVDVNTTACAVYGYSHEEMLHVSVEQLGSGVPPYTGADAARLIDQAKRDGFARAEWRRRNKDGSLHWDEVYLKSARIAGTLRVLAFTREITERKLAEESLRRSEDRLRTTLQAALDCIIVMDENGQVTEFNPAACACFGYQREQALGRPLAELIIPQRLREAHTRGMLRYLQTGHGAYLGRRVEVTALRSDGSEFPVELAISVAEGAGGRLFIGSLRDITERRQAEEKRLRLEAQLRQAQKMEALGQLTGGIAHDFNNLLTSIMGYVILAEERQAGGADERLGSYLEQAHVACDRARGLIRQMLMFSRGQKGEPRPVSLAPLLESSLALARPSLPGAIATRVAIEPDLPAVRLDPVQLEQVLLNLFINARDALGASGTITLSARTMRLSGGICASCRTALAGEFVEVSVADDGPGIPEAVAERMFEPFFSTKQVGKGTGMGLATVHGIVHEHGGHVLLETAPGAGASFRVLFPPLAGAAPAPPAQPPTPGRAAAPRFEGRVLVVDDDRLVGEFMRELLESWGLQVTVVPGGREALQALHESPSRYDLVITDQTMPGMTGLELARALRGDGRGELPVVLYTGFAERITESELEAVGVRALLHKPVEPQALAALVREHLRAPAAADAGLAHRSTA